jgi:hypothetical protein
MALEPSLAKINEILTKDYQKYRDQPSLLSKLSYKEFLELSVFKLRQELQIKEFIIEEVNKLLDLFPQCPDKVERCIPHAIEFMANLKEAKNGKDS